MRIAVDAMGGDFAPAPMIQGCLLAAEDRKDDTFVLVGDAKLLQVELDAAESADPAARARVSICHAPDVVAMGEHPVEALRAAPESSIMVATKLVAAGEANAVVSAGNTGATVAAASMLLRTLKGVKRPAIAVRFPAEDDRPVILLDAGANMACRPVHLLQYGVMAANYVRHAYGIENPRVGLLNVGEEATKGTELVQETHPLLSEAGIHYIGAVEGHDLPYNKCEVAVTDGFTGNCMLKAAEGLGRLVKLNAARHLTATMSKADCARAVDVMRSASDYSATGGALLLGVNGVVVIGHGRSDALAIRNAAVQAAHVARSGLNEAIVQEVSSLSGIGT